MQTINSIYYKKGQNLPDFISKWVDEFINLEAAKVETGM